MTRQHISSGSRYEEEFAYSRAVVDGDWVFVSGTTGFDYATMSIADDIVAQCEQCFTNIAAAQIARIGDIKLSANWMAPIEEIILIIISEIERPRASSLLERAVDRAQPRL